MIYFILYVFLEVMVSSAISGEIGGLYTFFELIISAILGIFLLQNFKFSLLEKINAVREGSLTQEEFVKSSIGAAIGAMLLIVPGFFTDILGLLLQFSLFTVVFTKIFKFRKPKQGNGFNRQQTNFANDRSAFHYTSQSTYTHKTKERDDDVIDVEIMDKDSEAIDNNKSIKH